MSKNILLCDDELHILRAAEFKFKRAGYTVRCAHDGEEAWELICEEKPDILISDCQMPRLDGLQLCRRIRDHQATANLPLIMLTAKGFELSAEETLDQLGILAVVPKPFSPRELFQRVEQILDSKQPAQAGSPSHA